MFISEIKNIDPNRIVSLVPSITTLLDCLQLENETIGITKFCIHPNEWFKTKSRIGGTKDVEIEKINKLNPDLIICSKEENVLEQVNKLAESFPVFLTDVKNYDDALQMIIDIGILTGKLSLSEILIKKINTNFENITAINKKAIYLIWQEPFMTVGGDTYINSMMEKAGFENLYKKELRYPIKTIEEIKKLNPSFVLLSSEPYPFKQKHIKELQIHLPKSKIQLVDGEIFSWYGNMMLNAPTYFAQLAYQINNG